MKLLKFLITHSIAIAIGFALGIYLLPVLIAPDAPSIADVMSSSEQTLYRGRFRKDLPGSDFLHWGEGEISITPTSINLIGSVSPGPDYQLYLTQELIETKQEFLVARASSAKIGPVKTFDNFIVPIQSNVDPNKYSAVLIWCETFEMYITAASYR